MTGDGFLPLNNRDKIAKDIFVALVKSAADQRQLTEPDIEKHVAIIAFKFADTFIEASNKL